MEELADADPRHVGSYEIVGVLGSGGMGTVYLGRAADGRLAAVKVIHADLARSPEFRGRFRREVAASRAVAGPRVAAVVDAGGEDAQPWLATEYVPGPSLQALVAQHGPMPAEKVRALGAGLAEALTTIHAAGLVHRDVKPPNVLLAEDGPKLIDFGIARSAADSTMTRTGVMLGTPQFMAPEQLRGRGTVVGPAADVFALAGVLCYAATGVHPFGDGLPEQMLYRIAHEEPDLTEVDPALRRVVRTCLAKEPAERPTAAELAAILSLDLRTLALGADPDVTPTDVLPRVAAEGGKGEEAAEDGRRRRWKLSLSWEFSLRWVWAITIGAGVTAAAVLLVLVMPGRPAHGSNQPQAGATPHTVVTQPTTAGPGTAPSPIGSAGPASDPPSAPASPNQPAGRQTPSTAPTGPATRPTTLPPTTTPAPQPPARSSTPGPPPPTASAPPPPPPTTPPANRPPQPVTGLDLAPQGPAYVQLQISWSAQSDATSYDILYNESLMGGHEIDGVSNTSTTISAVPQETVCVQMRAVNQYGKSPWSPSSPDCVRDWPN